MSKIFFSTILLILIYSLIAAQEATQSFDYDLKQQISSSLSQNLSLIGTGGLNISIDDTEYLVDAGDVFLIKIDVKGPAVNIFQTVVTPDGMVVLPNTPSVKVSNLRLKDAKLKIFQVIKDSIKDADIEVHLFQLHPIKVSIVGAVYMERQRELFSASRLFEAIQPSLQLPPEMQRAQEIQLQKDPNAWIDEKKNALFMSPDSQITDLEGRVSLRKIEVIRDGKSSFYDLLRFKLLGDMSQNPYLMNDDILKLSFKDEIQGTINISGAIGNPIQFEFISGDNLELAISFAGGLLPYADSSRLEVYRFKEDHYSLEKMVLDSQKDKDFLLQADDRISVRSKSTYRPKFSVEIDGEVKFPGKYPILEGSSTLQEIISKAGGFTKDASLSMSRIVRRKLFKEDYELKRLMNIQPTNMTRVEWSYYQLSSKEDLYIVDADFKKIFSSDNDSLDVLLRDLDIITVPRSTNQILVSGGVNIPGTYEYHPDWTLKRYIAAADGFARRARTSELRVVKERTGNWVDVNMEYIPEEGDRIFVPIKFERDGWMVFRDIMTVTAQFAAVVAVIVGLYR